MVQPVPRSDGGSPVLVLPARVTREAVPVLCERLRCLLAEHRGNTATAAAPVTVVCDVSGPAGEPDAVLIDALARLQLTARRQGARVVLRGAGRPLRELIALVGLAGTLDRHGLGPAGLQMRGQSEEREEPLGVEEGVEPGDAAL
ncbi:STAS domain-containing protein [Streptomyces sp. NPDC088733]|uniref:STAS domain-containing protein n=1 Tax=Streptomyces sp. NPDC088733 TaxID=3365880 RepID=UPI00381F0F54